MTSLLPVPTPWTSTGVGTAIPDSRLGAEPTPATTATETMNTPSNTLSFPQVLSTSAPPRASPTVNLTGFASYIIPSTDESPGYDPPSSTGEPPGYAPTSSTGDFPGYAPSSSTTEPPGYDPSSSIVPPPGYDPTSTTHTPFTYTPPFQANTSSLNIIPSTGEATPPVGIRDSDHPLFLMLIMCLLHVVHALS